ncbi:MAG TPA: hypothetical protein VFF03_08035 [Rhodocyclaceae bacterium]|nr:hypothetical protein [Rhodocyclaceae bacterium]
MKALAYIALLGVLAGLVWLVPILWELAVAGAIGGAYWIFFRIPPEKN